MGFMDEFVMEKPQEKLNAHHVQTKNKSTVSKIYPIYAHTKTNYPTCEWIFCPCIRKKSSASTGVSQCNYYESTAEGESKKDTVHANVMAAVEAKTD